MNVTLTEEHFDLVSDHFVFVIKNNENKVIQYENQPTIWLINLWTRKVSIFLHYK